MVGQIGGVMLPEQQRAAEIQRQQTQTAGNMGGRFMTPEMIAAQQAQPQQPTFATAGAPDYRPAGATIAQQQPAQSVQQTQPPQPVDIAQVLAQGPIDPATGQVRAFYDSAGQYQVVNGRLQSKLNL